MQGKLLLFRKEKDWNFDDSQLTQNSTNETPVSIRIEEQQQQVQLTIDSSLGDSLNMTKLQSAMPDQPSIYFESGTQSQQRVLDDQIISPSRAIASVVGQTVNFTSTTATDYVHPSTTSLPGFSDLATALNSMITSYKNW